MNSFAVKALCRQIEDRYGSNRNAAIAAKCSSGVWSTYCSDEHPDTTIPFHRILFVANAAEREVFIEFLKMDSGPASASLSTEACETLEAAADMQRSAREAEADSKITPLEERRIRSKAVGVILDAGEVLRAAGGAA